MSTKDEQPGRDPLLSLVRYRPETHYYGDDPSAGVAEDDNGEFVKYDDIICLINEGKLIRRDQLDADTTVRTEGGKFFDRFYIGPMKFDRELTKFEYDELIRRGAKIVS